ncbi:MAG: GNAT family N-acetyltransferase [Ruminococcus sp.]|nr:GNAT family N-acetyltransferase [Ruminococcus sp.]
MNRFELIDYEKIYEPQLLSFLEKCLPESGRALDIDGRHSFYKAISSHFVGFWYMLANEDIIGTVAVREMNGNDCELKSLYLLEKYQGQGYGRQLPEKAVNFAKNCGYEKMYLDSLSTSTRAVKLYRKFGFKDTEKYNESRFSDVFMVLEL